MKLSCLLDTVLFWQSKNISWSFLNLIFNETNVKVRNSALYFKKAEIVSVELIVFNIPA